MANVLDVAQYILERVGRTSTWKLQKLVYYSQAWHSVWEDEPLFDARIEAWANGPVTVDLYDRHKGQFSIQSIRGADAGRLNKAERTSIAAVVKHYGHFDGQTLSDLTHAEAPWKDARKGLPPGERGNNEITLDAMYQYYSSLKRKHG